MHPDWDPMHPDWDPKKAQIRYGAGGGIRNAGGDGIRPLLQQQARPPQNGNRAIQNHCAADNGGDPRLLTGKIS